MQNCDDAQTTAVDFHRNTLQHAATRYNTLEHAATRCNTLQHAATCCNINALIQNCDDMRIIPSKTPTHNAYTTHGNTLQHAYTLSKLR